MDCNMLHLNHFSFEYISWPDILSLYNYVSQNFKHNLEMLLNLK